MKKRSLMLAIACVVVHGCGSDETDGGRLVDPPPVGDDVFRVFTPVYEIPPADELFTCMTVPLDNTEDLLVAESSAWQTGGGHHVLILMVNADARTVDEPHECTDADMAVASLRFVGAGTADGGSIALPSNLALRIPPGRKLLLQSHYINTSDEPMQVQDVIDLRLADPDAIEYLAGAYAHVDTHVEIGARAAATRSVDCAPPIDGMNVPWMFAHMHELGAQAKIELIRDGETQVLYDEPWDPAFRDHFPYVTFDPPLTLRTTDRLRTTCTWENPEAENVLFPKEMCATFMPYYPAEGEFWVCSERGMNVEL